MTHEPNEQVHFHACTLCEATCGLEVRTRGREVDSIRGDADDVFSRGFICPKGASIVAERIRAKIGSSPIALEGETVPLSASVAYGGAEKIPTPEWMRRGGERATWEELSRWFIAEVDRALYEAKAAGKDRVVAAGDDGSIDAGFRAFLERAQA